MKTLVFLLGVLTGLAFNHIPRYPLFRDTPQTPPDWEPRFRRWKNGEEIK